MATQRTADLIIGAFKDEMSTRRKYVLETDEALTVSTQLLCKMAQKEDGSPAFDMSDAPILQRSIPEKVLNEIELFLFDVTLDLDTAKKE